MSTGKISLCEAYKDHFAIGAAVSTTTIDTHKDLLADHFNSVTAENQMKFSELHPTEGVYRFGPADRIVRFAEANNMIVRGHCLVWHNQTPSWVFCNADGSVVSRDTLLGRMKEHIDSVLSHYKGRVFCWDVVNEALDDSSSSFYRPTRWHDIIGPDYLEKAFQFAHEADPQAELFYNDYNESTPHKRDKIITLVKSLKAKGVPIHGVGLQAHWNIVSPSLEMIRTAIGMYADLGLKIHITELDVSVFSFDDRRTDLVEPTQEMLDKQAEFYGGVFEIFREYRDVITDVTLWGVADDYTWLDNFPVRGRKNWPLLFDTDHQPKKAFRRVVEF